LPIIPVELDIAYNSDFQTTPAGSSPAGKKIIRNYFFLPLAASWPGFGRLAP
jgi:hypothetical protein